MSSSSPSAAALARPVEDVLVRRVETLAEYHECVAIQTETWGRDFRELVPATILMVSQKLAGVCAAAFRGDGSMLGFVFGMTGVMEGELAHWSDLLAVRPEARGHGIGARLKEYQRELVRAVGVRRIYWTFDPLVARNAQLNLVRLGARVTEYVVDMYGSNTGSVLHGGIPTDRLLVRWDVDGTAAAAGSPGAERLRIPIPADIDALPLAERRDWRMDTRGAFSSALGRGYRVVGFRAGSASEHPSYELARQP
jgi:predicted GNAT superfamily acetyltransferase